MDRPPGDKPPDSNDHSAPPAAASAARSAWAAAGLAKKAGGCGCLVLGMIVLIFFQLYRAVEDPAVVHNPDHRARIAELARNIVETRRSDLLVKVPPDLHAALDELGMKSLTDCHITPSLTDFPPPFGDGRATQSLTLLRRGPPLKTLRVRLRYVEGTGRYEALGFSTRAEN